MATSTAAAAEPTATAIAGAPRDFVVNRPEIVYAMRDTISASAPSRYVTGVVFEARQDESNVTDA